VAAYWTLMARTVVLTIAFTVSTGAAQMEEVEDSTNFIRAYEDRSSPMPPHPTSLGSTTNWNFAVDRQAICPR
jgi:hypothetical protein